MYERYYGLRERPFKLTSNQRYLMLTSMHAEGLSTLQYGITHRLGIIVLSGEAGTGKTTVVRAAMASQPSGRFVLVNNSLLSSAEFCQTVGDGFGLSDADMSSKPRFLSPEAHARGQRRSGPPGGARRRRSTRAASEVLEEIRLLQTSRPTTSLLPVVLVKGADERPNTICAG
jgi:general secretion pathway protein A